jgi:hypothetical protein
MPTMKRLVVLRRGVALALVSTLLPRATAESTPEKPNALQDTVVLIIRHAEKPETGSGLTATGQERAEAYVKYFKSFTIDGRPLRLDHLFAAADSAKSQRPRLTLEPLARSLGMKIDSRFTDKNPGTLARELRAKSHGKQILICWRHGEIPELLRALGADPAKLLPDSKWPDQQYAWVIELRFDHQGRPVAEQSRRINENLLAGDSK